MTNPTTRNEILARARSWPANGVEYDQGSLYHDGYRQDCSGFVSMALGIPPSENGGWGGQNTVTLLTRGYVHEINPADLLPGDLVGILGPGTAGDFGHVVLFEKWVNLDPNNNDYHLIEQTPNAGPLWRVVTYPYPSGGRWRSYRFNYVADASPPPPPADPGRFAWPYSGNQYFGNIAGPDESHGGINPDEKAHVRNVQQWLILHGCAIGVPADQWATSSWADGIWENETDAAMSLWHARFYPNQPYPKQCWSDDYDRLARR